MFTIFQVTGWAMGIEIQETWFSISENLQSSIIDIKANKLKSNLLNAITKGKMGCHKKRFEANNFTLDFMTFHF